ncbi:LppP/LprE family lipoprotein [Williamsia sp. MIQD14]|uniref:LppP/LprE family lipoprotein n=1 Tax=Williamsia sp. MIQD14 TaxID=3425703 RepID=UPI003DA181E0
MTIVTRTATAVLGVCALASLAACGSDDATTATPSTVTVTASSPDTSTSVEAPETDVADTAQAGAGPGSEGGGAVAPAATSTRACGPVDGNSAQIDAAIAKIAPPLPGVSWVPTRANFNSCNSLSYVVLDTDRGTGSSPDQLLLFGPEGRFVGTGIKCNVAFQDVTGSGPDFVNVTYRYLRNENESNAGASGRAYVTFRWNGSRVVMEGTLPYEVTRGEC